MKILRLRKNFKSHLKLLSTVSQQTTRKAGQYPVIFLDFEFLTHSIIPWESSLSLLPIEETEPPRRSDHYPNKYKWIRKPSLLFIYILIWRWPWRWWLHSFYFSRISGNRAKCVRFRRLWRESDSAPSYHCRGITDRTGALHGKAVAQGTLSITPPVTSAWVCPCGPLSLVQTSNSIT